MTYTNIRNVAELFYFIVLTGVMAYYAKKSYQRSVEAKPDIITHIYIDYRNACKEGKVAIRYTWKFITMERVQLRI